MKDSIIWAVLSSKGEGSEGAKTAAQAAGIYGVFINIVKGVMGVGIFVEEMIDWDNSGKGWDVEKFINNLVGPTGGGLVAASALDDEEESKAVLVAGGALLGFLAFLLQAARLSANIADEVDHHAF